jgi:hypothetical protein
MILASKHCNKELAVEEMRTAAPARTDEDVVAEAEAEAAAEVPEEDMGVYL